MWNSTADGEWLVTREAAQCGDPNHGTPCFAGGFDTSDPNLCQAAGCCFAGDTTLSLWFSAERNDHFSDSLNCSDGCAGSGYVFMHNQALLPDDTVAGTVALNLYWNASPSKLVGGVLGDNVASSFPPAQAGYVFARVLGQVFDPSQPQPDGTITLKLFYSAAGLDHYTTASIEDENDAIAKNYTFVGLIGYAYPPQNATYPYLCYAPSGNQDLYLFGHGADYDAALQDYVVLTGPVPVPRRHWMGISWSKWNESQIQSGAFQQVEWLQQAGFPLDTYIFDMQWHLTPDWGGYQWDQSVC